MNFRSGLAHVKTPRLIKVKHGTATMPPVLSQRIASILAKVPKNALMEQADYLSTHLRARTRSTTVSEEAPVIAYDRASALAYLATRFPGVFGVSTRVLNELQVRRPELTPKRFLDYGAGPGTALLAAESVWGASLEAAVAIEPSEGMAWVLEQVLGDQLLEKTTINRYDGEQGVFDVVTVSYVLSELHGPRARRRLIRSLWPRVAVGGALIVMEPGTPVGAKCVREARNVLLGLEDHAVEAGGSPPGDARTVAPCPHDGACPLDHTKTWCHFGQRVRRERFALSFKRGATASTEDEKFSYAILEKVGAKPGPVADFGDTFAPDVRVSRLITPPRKRGGHVLLQLCDSKTQHVHAATVPKSHGPALYKSARKSGWGDVLLNLQDRSFEPPEESTDEMPHEE